MRLDFLQLYVESEPNSAALNMAVDQALLESAAAVLLRCYQWRRPSLSIGYFSKVADVQEQIPECDVVRRWTGGGIVPHGDDLTYSVIVAASHPLFEKSSLEIYHYIHAAIRQVLSTSGIAATVVEAPFARTSDACFANPVRADLLVEGRKIAGAAQRRTRAGLLHQGSIQLKLRADEFLPQLARVLSAEVQDRQLSIEQRARAAALVKERYGAEAWLRRR